MKHGFFKRQTLILVFSIVLGIMSLFLGIGYAFYVFNISISDLNPIASVKSATVDLKITPISGSLKLCESYPLSTSYALQNCEPYVFSVENSNKVDLVSYLNLEVYNSNTLPDSDIHVAFAKCSDSSCETTNYVDNILSSVKENVDAANENVKGYLLTAEKNFTKNTTKYYKMIVWQDEASVKENGTFSGTLGAISYTKKYNDITYDAYYFLANNESFTSETCKSSDGFEMVDNYCKKTYSVLDGVDKLPNIGATGYNTYWKTDISTTKEFGLSSVYSLYRTQYIYVSVVDDISPTCVAETVGGDNTNGFTITVTCSDEGSGCVEESKTYTGLLENKIFTVHDKAGNGGTCKSNAPVDQTKPTCSLKLDGTSIVATYEDDKGISYFGWDSSYSGEQIDYKAISAGTHTFYVKDTSDNTNTCSIDVTEIKADKKSSTSQTGSTKSFIGSCYCCKGQGGSTVGSYVSCNSSTGTCSCPGGTSVCRSTCTAKYDCPMGYTAVGSVCQKTYTWTEYSCNEGYVNFNNTWCYKY